MKQRRTKLRRTKQRRQKRRMKHRRQPRRLQRQSVHVEGNVQKRTAMQLNQSNPRSQLKRKTIINIQKIRGDDMSEEDEAEEDKAEEATEEDEAEEANIEVAKVRACGGKHAKKNSHAIEPGQSKKTAKMKNNKQSQKITGDAVRGGQSRVTAKDKAEEATEEDEAEAGEATVVVAKAISACGGEVQRRTAMQSNQSNPRSQLK